MWRLNRQVWLAKVRGGRVRTICFCLLGISLNVAAITVRLQNGVSGIGTTYAEAEDTYLRQAFPVASAGKYGGLTVGRERYQGGGNARILVRYDLTDLQSLWQSNTAISGARILIYFQSVDGIAFTNRAIKVYRISPANKGWSAGTSVSRVLPETGASCWNFRMFDSTFYPTGSTLCDGCHRDQTWNGDSARWSPYTGTFSGVGSDTIGHGCGISGIDYSATEIASTIVSSTAVGSWITFTITDVSFLKSWVDNRQNNEGFLIVCPDLENMIPTTSSALMFPSSENSSYTLRPIFELDVENAGMAATNGFTYTLPAAGNVSIHISDSTGKVVKEKLFAASRTAGNNYEFWDCKDDPQPQKCDTPSVVPDGKYTVKILQTQGITCEYLLTIGSSQETIFPEYQFPGNYATPGGIDADATGIYIGSMFSEQCVELRKQSPDGKLIFAQSLWTTWDSPSKIAVMGDTIHCVDLNGNYTRRSASAANRPIGTSLSMKSGAFSTYDYWDIAAGGGKVVVAITIGLNASGIQWVDGFTGTKLGSPVMIPHVRGVAMDISGNAFVVVDTQVVKYVYGTPAGTPVVLSRLVAPDQLSINKTNGDLYVIDNGPMQVKQFTASGVFLRSVGIPGGRKPYGIYDPVNAGGFCFTSGTVNQDIATAPDGSFYISERVPMRRVAHYTREGALIKEWYCGTVLGPHGSPEPADPRLVWLLNGHDALMRTQIDYADKTWKPIGNYLINKPGLTSFVMWSKWNPVNRGGNTYLASESGPVVFVLDKEGDSLKLVAAGGYKKNADGSITVGSVLDTGYSAADLNGNGRFEAEEVTSNTGRFVSNYESQYSSNNLIVNNNAVDSNFIMYGNLLKLGMVGDPITINPVPGPVQYVPQLVSVNGYMVPKYNLTSGRSYPFSGSLSALESQSGKWNAYGAALDGKGAVFYGWLGNVDDTGLTGCGYSFSYEKNYGSARISKCNLNTGKVDWIVGKLASQLSAVAPGYVSGLTRMLGAARGCIFVASSNPVQYIYDSDGLYVGHVYDTKLPVNGMVMPADNVLTFGEQWAGKVVEVIRDDIPGLTKGDVLFFSSASNAVNVFRLRGFDSFYKCQVTLTVSGGRIIAQDPSVIDTATSAQYLAAGNFPRSGTMSLSAINFGVRQLVNYTIPFRARVSLELYSLLGQRIATVVNGQTMEAGSYTADLSNGGINGQHRNNGFYFVRLKVGDHCLTRQVVTIW